MSRSFTIILLFSMILSLGHCTPVLFWNAEVTPRSVFPRIKYPEFHEEIKKILEDKMLVAFTYYKLSLKHFRCEDCFTYLSQQSPAFFYANVERADEALQSLDPVGDYSMPPDGRFEAPIVCEAGKLYMISLDSFRGEASPMRTCDKAIRSVTASIECEEIAYAFLGTHEESSELSGTLFQANMISFYFTQLALRDTDGLHEIEIQNMNVTGEDPRLRVELQTNDSRLALRFNLFLSNGYFEIHSFKYNDTIYYVSDLNAPQTHSFSCGKITLENEKKKLILSRIQIQYDSELHSERTVDFKFKDAWTCEGFVSPAIISGLFITAILLAILSVGISMLLSVQSPTAFETEGGPMLQINVVNE
ncbi:V-type proton ATPase subunit S1-like [Anastrepha ludens]|uniref:V-type proton ATPase subunit S1-like n=1 Tax=Anastrepha ludens TaxID=28586 RepID=UPI0023B1FEA6|nr:V-type proton ATPase subunit S1-like [Anastrepha ludens]